MVCVYCYEKRGDKSKTNKQAARENRGKDKIKQERGEEEERRVIFVTYSFLRRITK